MARSNKTTQKPILIDLALQGGGSHGAFTWGVLDRMLEEKRFTIEAISGTSAGAMNAAVLADFDAKKVHLLRADWTRRDPAITAALAALGRNGVPVYVVYKPGQAPVVLSEILSVAEVRAALVLP